MVLHLKQSARKEAIYHNMTFVDYMWKYHQSWCEMARAKGLPYIQQDLILVRGCVNTTEARTEDNTDLVSPDAAVRP